ncbi:lytic transglycosylase domain-containing protein [Thermoflavimicrobium dichotomicum]|uniref:Soluble lytic murein transglycosylase n=1 Tax=Thermoflavimicrobium dichotomicum TaxID=46223 RepID=A0A1I3LAW0_9BACL|nr:lytic transglycosylase domain-containing protein [Thermoflavimicrobium dichotomicum]SFI81535.1 soluble lytic murein transglycosylase [Thermoflavimicrobium dichotomicum]
MELSKIKKWIKPAINALPSKRELTILFIILLIYLFVMTPILNRWIYPLEYEEYIFNSAKQYNTDPYFIMAIIRVETKFDPEGRSRVGAQGLMQIMPETMDWAISYGNFSPSLKSYIHDPATNIQVGSWYISFLMKKFKGNKVAVAAAYNRGPTKVKGWLDKGIWDGTRKNSHQIPVKETRDYVERVTYYYDKYRTIYSDLAEKYNYKP